MKIPRVKRITRTCKYCGRLFYILPCQKRIGQDRSEEGNYCSLVCSGAINHKVEGKVYPIQLWTKSHPAHQRAAALAPRKERKKPEWTEENRSEKSEFMKRMWRNPEFRDKMYGAASRATRLPAEAVKTMSEIEKSWLACAIDSEGSIMFAYWKNRGKAGGFGSPEIQVVNTNYKFVERCQSITGVGSIHNRKQYAKLNNKPAFRWVICGRVQVHAVLVQIESYLIIKQAQSQNIRKYIENAMLRAPTQEEVVLLKQTMAVLNAKGKPIT